LLSVLTGSGAWDGTDAGIGAGVVDGAIADLFTGAEGAEGAGTGVVEFVALEEFTSFFDSAGTLIP
jgi:hypothetical protein